MAEHGENITCHYLDDKPKRDQVRQIIHNKILAVDEVVTELYKLFDEEHRLNKEKHDRNEARDKKQDADSEELKGSVQEVAAHQQITHNDVVVMKKEIEKLNAAVERMSGEMHNGFAKKIMAEAYNHTVKQNNEMMNKIIDIVQQNSQNNSQTIQKQNDNSTNVWKGIFGKSGIAAGLIGLAALIIKLILG